jgi:hypothetical protein
MSPASRRLGDRADLAFFLWREWLSLRAVVDGSLLASASGGMETGLSFPRSTNSAGGDGTV